MWKSKRIKLAWKHIPKHNCKQEIWTEWVYFSWGLQDSFVALDDQMFYKRPSRKQQSGTSMAHDTRPGQGHAALGAAWWAGQVKHRILQWPHAQRGRAGEAQLPSAAGICSELLVQSKSTWSLRENSTHSDKILELQLSPVRSLLNRQHCQGAIDLVWLSNPYEKSHQYEDGPRYGWDCARKSWNAEEKLLMACEEWGCSRQDARRSLTS